MDRKQLLECYIFMGFQVAAILQKSETDRTAEETGILVSCSDVVKEVNLRYSHFENH